MIKHKDFSCYNYVFCISRRRPLTDRVIKVVQLTGRDCMPWLLLHACNLDNGMQSVHNLWFMDVSLCLYLPAQKAFCPDCVTNMLTIVTQPLQIQRGASNNMLYYSNISDNNYHHVIHCKLPNLRLHSLFTTAYGCDAVWTECLFRFLSGVAYSS